MSSLKKQLDSHKIELEALSIAELQKKIKSDKVAQEYIADSNTSARIQKKKSFLIHALVFSKCRKIANTSYLKCINNS